MAERGALERAHVRSRLIRELAHGDKTKTALAKSYGVTQQSVSDFAQRHAQAIADAKARLEDEFSHLWIADKAQRVAEYQEQFDQIAAALESGDWGVHMNTAELMRAGQSALRAVAEELGQLPSRQTIQHEGGVTVRYELVGIDPETLT